MDRFGTACHQALGNPPVASKVGSSIAVCYDLSNDYLRYVPLFWQS